MDTSRKPTNFCSKCATSFTSTACPKCSRRMFLPKKLFWGVTFLAVFVASNTILLFLISPDFNLSVHAFVDNSSTIFSNDKALQNVSSTTAIKPVTKELNTYSLTKKTINKGKGK